MRDVEVVDASRESLLRLSTSGQSENSDGHDIRANLHSLRCTRRNYAAVVQHESVISEAISSRLAVLVQNCGEARHHRSISQILWG